MKYFVILLVVALDSLAAFAERGKPVIFVDKFIPNAGCAIPEGIQQTLRDRIVGNLTSSGKYDVVDRQNLERVQKEIELADAGLTEGKAPESNRLKAAGYCVYGKVLQYRSYMQNLDIQQRVYGTVEVQLRIEDIQSGQILDSPTVKVEEVGKQFTGIKTTQDMSDAVLAGALDSCAKKVVIKLNDMAFPVYIDDADGKYVTGNVAAELVAINEVWDVWKVGQKIMDRDTGKWTGRYREKLLCKVRVAIPGATATKFECCRMEDGRMLEEMLNQGTLMILRRAVPEIPVDKVRKTSRRSLLDNIR